MEMGKLLSPGALESSGEDLRMSTCGSQDQPAPQPLPSRPGASSWEPWSLAAVLPLV